MDGEPARMSSLEQQVQAKQGGIAREFGISPRTVEAHRARLWDKLQADRASDLLRIRFALDQGGGDKMP